MTIGRPAPSERTGNLREDHLDQLRNARELEQRAWDLVKARCPDLIPPSDRRSKGLDRQAKLTQVATSRDPALRAVLVEVRSLMKQVEQIRWSATLAHDGLVKKLASRLLSFFDSDVRFDDLHQLGRLGLYEGLKRFDPDLGITVSTYGKWWIRAKITREAPLDGLTSGTREQFRTLRKMESAGVRGDEELAERMGLTVKRIRMLRVLNQKTRSLDEPCDADDRESGMLGDRIVDETAGPSEILDLEQVMDRIRELPERSRTVLELRFGLAGSPAKTLNEVGKILGVSRERVRQIESQALSAIRNQMGVLPSWSSEAVDSNPAPETPATPKSIACVQKRVVDVVLKHPDGITTESVARIVGRERSLVNRAVAVAVMDGVLRTNGLPRKKAMVFPGEHAGAE